MICQIAVAGCSGSGKSGVAALLACLMRDSGVKPVLAVESDPGGNLSRILGMPEAKQVIGMVEEVVRVEGESKERLLDQRLQQECVSEGEGMDFLDVGRPGGLDGYCYMNNTLREALSALNANYRAVVVNCEPELLHLKRMNSDDINCLLIVSSPDPDQVRRAAEIAGQARELGVAVRRIVLLLTGPSRGGAADSACFDAIIESPEEMSLPGPDLPHRGKIPAIMQSLLKKCIAPAKAAVPEGALEGGS
jgi:CO dehydrogenase nickel-insertion accessory protein CooC1